MKLLLLVLCLLLVSSSAANGQSSVTQEAEKSWSTFYSVFQAAVTKRDRVALKKLMASKITYENEFEGTPNDLIKSLDAYKGEGWRILRGAIDKGIQPYTPHERRPGKKFYSAINSTPCLKKPCGYSAWAIFTLGNDNKWRWTDFLYIEK
jgi:hypothetical protein